MKGGSVQSFLETAQGMLPVLGAWLLVETDLRSLVTALGQIVVRRGGTCGGPCGS